LPFRADATLAAFTTVPCASLATIPATFTTDLHELARHEQWWCQLEASIWRE
jgi:hypothetical protein